MRGVDAHVEALDEALRSGQEAHRAAARELEPREGEPLALWALQGSVLDEAEQILHELDPRHGPHPGAVPPSLRRAA
ncbi:hypothetical protein [Streptomyces sp. NPDC001380]|uniref:hypothetical protein n=1 Tax=Streptomyces sp. NPDC001380 TaxID=3364566 RepID=UPI00369AE065